MMIEATTFSVAVLTTFVTMTIILTFAVVILMLVVRGLKKRIRELKKTG